MAIVSANGAALPQSPNYIINGAFDFWQRGTSFNSIGTYVYFADRWGTGAVFSPNVMNITRESFPVGIGSTLDFEYEYFARFTRTISGTAATYFGQKIENVRTLAGKTVTLSYWARVSSGTLTAPRVFLNQQFGSGGSTEVDNLGSVSPTYTTTWTRFKQTVSVPSISGKTLGSGHNLWVLWQLPDSGNFTLDITGVQLEEGSIATPFRRNSPNIQAELAACQYYFQRYISQMPGRPHQIDVANRPEWMLTYTQKRVSPSVTVTTPTGINWTNYTSGVAYATTGYAGLLTGSQPNEALMFFTVSSGIGAFTGPWGPEFSTNVLIDISAEL